MAEVIDKVLKETSKQIDHFVKGITELGQEVADCTLLFVRTLRNAIEATGDLVPQIPQHAKVYVAHPMTVQRLTGIVTTTLETLKYVVLVIFVQIADRVRQDGETMNDDQKTLVENLALVQAALCQLDKEMSELRNLVAGTLQAPPAATDVEKKEARAQLKTIAKKVTQSRNALDDCFGKICKSKAFLEGRLRIYHKADIFEKGSDVLKIFGIQLNDNEINLTFLVKEVNPVESVLKSFGALGNSLKGFTKSFKKTSASKSKTPTKPLSNSTEKEVELKSPCGPQSPEKNPKIGKGGNNQLPSGPQSPKNDTKIEKGENNQLPCGPQSPEKNTKIDKEDNKQLPCGLQSPKPITDEAVHSSPQSPKKNGKANIEIAAHDDSDVATKIEDGEEGNNSADDGPQSPETTKKQDGVVEEEHSTDAILSEPKAALNESTETGNDSQE